MLCGRDGEVVATAAGEVDIGCPKIELAGIQSSFCFVG